MQCKICDIHKYNMIILTPFIPLMPLSSF